MLILKFVAEWQLVTQLKERTCYVAKDYETEMAKAKEDPSSMEKSIVLAAERNFILDSERFQSSELLFDPYLQCKSLLFIML